MAWNGTGTFTRTNGTNTGSETWQDDAAAATKIRADRHDTHDQDLATGLNACLTHNNESKPTAHFLPNVDATYSLGSASAQWGDGFFSGNMLIGGTLGITGALSLGASGGGDTQLNFYDDTNSVNRSLFWDNSESAFYAENSSSVNKKIATLQGNIIHGRVPASTGTGTVSGGSGFTYSWSGLYCTVTHNFGTTLYTPLLTTYGGVDDPAVVSSLNANSVAILCAEKFSFMFILD